MCTFSHGMVACLLRTFCEPRVCMLALLSWLSVSQVSNSYRYKMAFRSRCACKGVKCDHPANTITFQSPEEAEAVTSFHASTIDTCSVKASGGDLADGHVDVTSLDPLTFSAPQRYIGHESEPALNGLYTWSVGFCQRVWRAPAGFDPCTFGGPGAGFVQQYSDHKCYNDFNELMFGPYIRPGTSTAPDAVIFHFRDTTQRSSHTHEADVEILCNPFVKGVRVPESVEAVTVEDRDDDTRVYTFVLESECACPGKCNGEADHGDHSGHGQRPILGDRATCTVSDRGQTYDLTPVTYQTWELTDQEGQVERKYLSLGVCHPLDDSFALAMDRSILPLDKAHLCPSFHQGRTTHAALWSKSGACEFDFHRCALCIIGLVLWRVCGFLQHSSPV